MAPSTALQSRINAFESLGGQPSASIVKSASKSRPRRPSNPLDKPISPTATTIQPITPSRTPKPPASRSPSPPNLGRKTSLIDLKDWVVDDGPAQKQNGHANGDGKARGIGLGLPSSRNVTSPPLRSSTAPLINFESQSPPPPKVQAPPLPPRKPSKPSLRSTASAPVSPPSLAQSQSKDSLTVESQYSSMSKLDVAALGRRGQGHVPASSVSSFHSISLSSDGGTDGVGTPTSVSEFVHTYPMDRGADTDSLDGSYENVNVSAATSVANSPVVSISSHDWEFASNNGSAGKRTEPPKLPRRPVKPPSSPISSPPSVSSSLPTSPRLTPTPSQGRRAPPPPPPIRSRPPSSRTSITSFSDRSSILSNGTSTSRTSVSTFGSVSKQLLRPTPVPIAARRRYEKVFDANVVHARQARLVVPSQTQGNRKSRSAAGWRGLSVDLITSPEPETPATPSTPMPRKDKGLDDEEDVGSEERLDGAIVRRIWMCSKLERRKLRDLWCECDPNGTGSLDRDAFVKGMWRIDEELRRAQLLRGTRSPPRRMASRPILR